MTRINVTKSFLPPLEEYHAYLEQIWQSNHLTNQGPILKEFEVQTKKYLDIDNFHFVTNGTLALHIALRALDITEGEIITTPFSFVATTSSIIWEHCTPVFVDIEPDTFCIDADKIEAAITEKTKAIMAVHVFGYPCDIEKIDAIAKKHDLRVIYDGAHAFGAQYKGKSLLSYGDITTCSFHATKLLHTIEGGAIIAKDKAVSDKIELLKKFGFEGEEYVMPGVNAKASEFQAAMGLSNLKYIDEILNERRRISELYTRQLQGKLQLPVASIDHQQNYIYYPVVFESQTKLLEKMNELISHDIYARRYFYPSLNQLPYLTLTQPCPVSEDISSRVLCLPLYPGLEDATVREICEVLLQ